MKKPLPPPRTGFSLIEIVVVVSIIALITALTLPAISALGRTSRLTNASTALLDELNLARQTALTQNRAVELRFYSLRGVVAPEVAIRAARVLLANDSGDYLSPISALKTFPAGVIALADQKFSTLLCDATNPRQSGDVEDLPRAPATPYTAIRFRPTGGVELSAYTATGDNWFLTLKTERDPAFADRPANNYATIQLDPVTGRARMFRP